MPSEVAAEAPRLHGYQPTQLSDDDDDDDADVDGDVDGDSRTRTYHQVKGLTASRFLTLLTLPRPSPCVVLTFFVCIKVATEAAAIAVADAACPSAHLNVCFSLQKACVTFVSGQRCWANTLSVMPSIELSDQ